MKPGDALVSQCKDRLAIFVIPCQVLSDPEWLKARFKNKLSAVQVADKGRLQVNALHINRILKADRHHAGQRIRTSIRFVLGKIIELLLKSPEPVETEGIVNARFAIIGLAAARRQPISGIHTGKVFLSWIQGELIPRKFTEGRDALNLATGRDIGAECS